MKKLFALLFIAGVLTGCSKDDNGGGEEPSPSTMLVKKITTSEADDSLEATFEYDGRKLKKVVYSGVSDGENISMTLTATYSGNKISKFSMDMDDVGAFRFEYTYDGDRLIKEVNIWEGQATIIYNYHWENDNKVRKTVEDFPTYYEDFYFENGNVVKIVDYFESGTRRNEISHDNKLNPFSGIEGLQYLVDQEMMFSEGKNNPIKDLMYLDDALVSTTTYEYEYNSSGYPEVVIEREEEGTTTSTITYY